MKTRPLTWPLSISRPGFPVPHTDGRPGALAELATARHIELGDLSGMTTGQWLERWSFLRSGTRTSRRRRRSDSDLRNPERRVAGHFHLGKTLVPRPENGSLIILVPFRRRPQDLRYGPIETGRSDESRDVRRGKHHVASVVAGLGADRIHK